MRLKPVLALLFVLVASVVVADTLWLRNEEILDGKIERRDSQNIYFKTLNGQSRVISIADVLSSDTDEEMPSSGSTKGGHVSSVSPPSQKVALPSKDKIAEAENTIKDIFKDEYGKQDTGSRKALAEKLLQQAEDPSNDVAAKYVLLTEAANLAADAGDLKMVTVACSRMAEKFEGDTIIFRGGVLARAARSAKESEVQSAIAEAYIALSSESLMAERFDIAKKAADAASACAAQAKDAGLVNRAKRHIAFVTEARSALDVAVTARETLKTNVDDTTANLALGRWLCFYKNDWSGGLPLLTKSGDAALAAVAKSDTESPQEAKAQATVADTWFALGEKETSEHIKTCLWFRAKYWYSKSVGGVGGLLAERTKRRIEQIDQLGVAGSASTPTKEAPSKYISVTTLTPVKVEVGWSSLGVNQWTVDNNTPVLKPYVLRLPDGDCREYLFAHANSYATYNVPKGARSFTAIGYNAVNTNRPRGIRNLNSFKFAVICDGKEVFRSNTVDSYPNNLVPINVQLPKGVKTVTLRAESTIGDSMGMHATWCYPRFQRAGHQGDQVTTPVLGEKVAAIPVLKKAVTVNLGGGVKMELVPIQPGSFQMGSEGGDPAETPVHKVNVSKPFYMGKYEVTQEQWEQVMGNNPSAFKGAKNPVEQVSWNDCQEFLKKLNALKKGSITFRLPTEAEWEYACRAGSKMRFSFGNADEDLHKYGNYCDSSNTLGIQWQDKAHSDGFDGTAPVGSFPPNTWGLYDMHGNVWEWCQDWYGGYGVGEQKDPVGGPASGRECRVLRGGSWHEPPSQCRSAYRWMGYPGNCYGSYGQGFRVVCVAGQD